MNTQTIANKLVQIFRQNGLTRQHPSFFGQALSSQASFGPLESATPQMAMLHAFRTAKLTVAEATFFGLPRHWSINQPIIAPQPTATPAKTPQIFHMPKRSDQAA